MNCSSPSRQEGRGGVRTRGRSQVAAKMTISREGLAGLERSDLGGPCRIEPRQRGRNSEEATKYCRRSKKCRRWSLLELSVYMQCNFTGRPVSKGGQGLDVQPRTQSFHDYSLGLLCCFIFFVGLFRMER